MLVALLLVICCLAHGAVAFAEVTTDKVEFFERRVRPLFAEHCVKCHGPERQESGLRLDDRARLIQGGDRGPALVAGDSSVSLLFRAVQYSSEDLQMPPDGQLNSEQIADIEKWIDEGAEWPEPEKDDTGSTVQMSAARNHWAFEPIITPRLPPTVFSSDWRENAIDRFVLSALEKAKLDPSPPADRGTLARRAYLDLTGLPPSYDQIEEFVVDGSSNSFEQLVDRLLSERAYGEHWARHWLDVARYADTKGYLDGGETNYAFAYTYRDYVIRAFNDDLPFDEFVMDQLAADQRTYTDEQRWRLAAMGYLTLGRRFNHNLHDIIDDRIDVVTRGLMGLTVACARCHDHKYDPISTADYYSMYGMMASSREPTHPHLPLAGNVEESTNADDSEKYTKELAQQDREYQEKFAGLHSTIQHELRAFASDYLVYVVQELPQHREGPQNPLKTDRTILRGPSAYGFGAIVRWRRYVNQLGADDPVFGIWHRMIGVAPERFAGELANQFDAAGKDNAVLKQAIETARPANMVLLARCYGQVLESVYEQWKSQLAQQADSCGFDDLSREQLRQVLYGANSPAMMSADEAVDCYHLDEHTEIRNTLGKVETVSVKFAGAPARAMMLVDVDQPQDAPILLRGQPDRPGRVVARQVPSLLTRQVLSQASQRVGNSRPPLTGWESCSTSTSGRLELARAIVDPRNPLTARVLVNRVWQWHFGSGLVATANDFGVRSSGPTHPELLDYLARWFMDNGWSVKKLQRLIMLSKTYQQASVFRPDAAAIDPTNELRWRFEPRRLSWESMRDSLLTVSNRLKPCDGGRPIAAAPDDPDTSCRTIYIRIDRQQVSRTATNFDFPAPDFPASRRNETTVPQQQLFFFNSPFVLKQADSVAEMTLSGDKRDDSERVSLIFQLVLARQPSPAELEASLSFVRTQDAGSEIKQPSANEPTELDSGRAAELRRWSRLAHALLFSNEFAFID